MSPRSSSAHHLDYLDSLRGLAALVVLWSHYVACFGAPLAWEHPALANSPLHIVWDGFAAVSIFFVLSGFVLSLKYFDDRGNADFKNLRVGHYLIARTLRIAVPYGVVLALSIAAQLYFTRDVSTLPNANSFFHQLRDVPVSYLAIRHDVNLFRLTDYLFVPQAWTLSVELVLSFLIPVAVLVAAATPAWSIFFVLLATVSLNLSPHALAFSIGSSLARRFRQNRLHYATRSPLLEGFFWLGVLYLLTDQHSISPYLPMLTRTWMWGGSGVGAGLLLFRVLSAPRAQRALRSPLLRFLGKISYSVYLCHMLVIFWFTPRFLAAVNPSRSADLWAVSWIGGLLFTTVATLSLAYGLYLLIEAPSIRWSKSWGRYPVTAPTPHDATRQPPAQSAA